MSFDISRKTFDAWKDYFGVVMQQGRVQMDSDWNEWLAELTRRLQAGTLDLIGMSGVPTNTPSAFQISVNAFTSPVQITIGAGRMYVDGILVENHAPEGWTQWDPTLAEWSGPSQALDYRDQPYLHGASIPAGNGPFLVYLDVWQREVSSLQDPDLVEKAVGVDTTGRYQIVWQVKLKDVSSFADVSCSNPAIDPVTLFPPSTGRLTTGVGGVSPATSGPCSISPAAGYTDQENQLYRVEIHQGGSASSATFKWSRDNASVVTSVTAISSNVITVQSLGKDQVLGFSPGNWIEITCDSLELQAAPGELHRIAAVDATANTITLDSAVVSPAIAVTGPTDPSRHTRIVRWDQSGLVYESNGATVCVDLNATNSDGTLAGSNGIPISSGTTLILEDGITVSFDLANGGGTFQTGDFWTFAARTVDASIEILNNAAPFGIHHHYCRLAIADFSATPAVSDCRRLFPSLANPAVHVMDVRVGVGSNPLVNGGTISVQDLGGGISLVCDVPVDPSTVTPAPPKIPYSPVCVLTVDVPADTTLGLGFNPIVLAANVTLGPSNTINCKPVGVSLPTSGASTQPLLARFTLKGSAIRAADNPNVYLNGAAAVVANTATGLQLPSGDGRPFADFQMWFWLTSQPTVTLSPAQLTFPDTSVKSSSTLSVLVTNNGSTSLTVGPASGDFIQTTMPAQSPPDSLIPAGATGTISVTFTPTTTGIRAGQIDITGSADGPLEIGLSGNGIEALMQIDNTGPLNFPKNQPVSTSSAAQTVTLTSLGQEPLTIFSILLTDPVSFSQTNTCIPQAGGVATLQDGESCAIAVVFNPQAAVQLTESLVITHNAANVTSPLTIQLTGTGNAGVAAVSAPTFLNFPFPTGGNEVSSSVTLESTGTSPLVIGTPVITGHASGSFHINSIDPPVGTPIQPGASCTIYASTSGIIQTSPIFDNTATMTIAHNAPTPSVVIKVTIPVVKEGP